MGSGKGCGLAGAEETAANEAKPTFTSCWGSGPRAGLGVHGQAWGAGPLTPRTDRARRDRFLVSFLSVLAFLRHRKERLLFRDVEIVAAFGNLKKKKKKPESKLIKNLFSFQTVLLK